MHHIITPQPAKPTQMHQIGTWEQPRCRSCNQPWREHLGIEPLCKELELTKYHLILAENTIRILQNKLDNLESGKNLRDRLHAQAQTGVHSDSR